MQLATLWLSKMPLTADRVEAVVQHELLVRLVEARDARILGAVSAECIVMLQRRRWVVVRAEEDSRTSCWW